jgi:hypothetical protein
MDALKTILDVLKTAKETGKIKASPELVEKRLKICGFCEHYNGITCKSCGCIMDIKTALHAAKCPLDRWDEKLVEEAIYGEMTPTFEKVACCGSTF